MLIVRWPRDTGYAAFGNYGALRVYIKDHRCVDSMACVAWLGVLEGPGCAHAPWSRFELHCSGIIVARRLYSCCVWCAVEHLKDDTVQKSEERSTAAQYANPNRHTTPYRALFPISIQTTDSPTKVILFHSLFRICICMPRQLRLLVARSLYTILVL